ncbi:hypothetical protein Btru_008396 [Bulinus truncatus]|nr:hypothetical protein Btru_008396 [Bulinus truncatus]
MTVANPRYQLIDINYPTSCIISPKSAVTVKIKFICSEITTTKKRNSHTKNKQTNMECQLFGLVTILVYACATYAHPASNRREDLKHLVSLLGRLKDLDNNNQLSHQASAINAARLATDLQDSKPVSAGVEEDSKGLLNRPAGMLFKRQGEWSYDYGLGGGRFGKRNYGDYGIGGGRFGRDVDHVDLSDANDPDLLS